MTHVVPNFYNFSDYLVTWIGATVTGNCRGRNITGAIKEDEA
jgi:hypothetical protein